MLRSLAIRFQLPVNAIRILHAIRYVPPNVWLRIVLFRFLGISAIICIVFSSYESVLGGGLLVSRILARWVLRHLIFKRKVQGCVLPSVLSCLIIILFLRLFVQLFSYRFPVDHLWDIQWHNYLFLSWFDAEFLWVDGVSIVSRYVNLAVNLFFLQHRLALGVSNVELILFFLSYLLTDGFLRN